MKQYILKDGKPVPEPDILKWAEWFENPENRVVRQTTVGNVLISTVFLGLDHRLMGNGPPLLWETMVFGDSEGIGEQQERFSDEASAVARHRALVAAVSLQLAAAKNAQKARSFAEFRDAVRAAGGDAWDNFPDIEAELRDIKGIECHCHRCIEENDIRSPEMPEFKLNRARMILCPDCGNKRCPHASDHRLECTNSNEPGQKGSVFE